jgi:hypothetical protein
MYPAKITREVLVGHRLLLHDYVKRYLPCTKTKDDGVSLYILQLGGR